MKAELLERVKEQQTKEKQEQEKKEKQIDTEEKIKAETEKQNVSGTRLKIVWKRWKQNWKKFRLMSLHFEE